MQLWQQTAENSRQIKQQWKETELMFHIEEPFPSKDAALPAECSL